MGYRPPPPPVEQEPVPGGLIGSAGVEPSSIVGPPWTASDAAFWGVMMALPILGAIAAVVVLLASLFR